MWKFEPFLKKRFFSEYENVVEVLREMNYFRTLKNITECRGYIGAGQ